MEHSTKNDCIDDIIDTIIDVKIIVEEYMINQSLKHVFHDISCYLLDKNCTKNKLNSLSM